MKNIICRFKGHKRDKKHTNFKNKYWNIKCKRCGYEIGYTSPLARLVGTEIKFGFDGK